MMYVTHLFLTYLQKDHAHAGGSVKVKKIDDPKLIMELFGLVDKGKVKELHDTRHIDFLKSRDAIGDTLLHR
jgi:hypothetical protein